MGICNKSSDNLSPSERATVVERVNRRDEGTLHLSRDRNDDVHKTRQEVSRVKAARKY